MAEHHVLKIATVLDHGEGGDGAYAGVKVADDKGRELVVLVPHEKAGEFAARLRAGAAYAATKRAGETPDAGATDWPLTLPARNVNVGQRPDGRIALRLELVDGMVVDVPLPDAALGPIRDAFARAADIKDGGAEPTEGARSVRH